MKLKKTIKDIRTNESGFSLIELLVAIVLLALIVGAFLSGFVVSTKTNITSGKIVDEGYVAQTYMENVIQTSYGVTTTEELHDALEVEFGDGSEDGANYIIQGQQDGYYVRIILSEETDPNLTYTKILIDIYEDSTYSSSVARLQNIIVL
jgi:prepilin-type N-terminal cleavage/methylation domain-containing protein